MDDEQLLSYLRFAKDKAYRGHRYDEATVLYMAIEDVIDELKKRLTTSKKSV